MARKALLLLCAAFVLVGSISAGLRTGTSRLGHGGGLGGGLSPGLADEEELLFSYAAGDDITAKGGTFSRTSAATYTDANGVVQWARANLAVRSQEFDNAAWSKSATVTVDASAAAAPDGTITAERLTWSGAATQHDFIGQGNIHPTGANKTYVVSCWLRTESGTANVRLDITQSGVANNYSSDLSVTTTWQRFEFTFTNGSGGSGTRHGLVNALAGGGRSVLAWGYQVEDGYSVATAYMPTTAAAYYDIRDAHYINGVRSTLLEGQRTNLCTRSQEFDNAAWGVSAATVTANAAVAPDGTTTAEEIAFTANTGKLFRSGGSTIGISASTAYTHSVWMRAKTGTFALKLSRTNTSSWTGATTSSEITLTTTWQRYNITYTSGGAETASDFVIGDEDASAYVLPATGNIYVWQAQAESGAFRSSEIPTTSATVTRAADSLSFPFTHPPQEMSVYVRGVEMGTSLTGATGIFHIGTASSPRTILYSPGAGRYSFYHNGLDAGGAAPIPVVAIADPIETIGRISSSGEPTLIVSVNGAAAVSASGAASALGSAWSAETLRIGNYNGASGFFAFRNVIVSKGTRDMSFFRSKAP